MSEHVGRLVMHTRKQGKPRRCEWCGQMIVTGERYGKWLYFTGGERTTVYAHAECVEAWHSAADEEGGVAYACGDNERPPASGEEGR